MASASGTQPFPAQQIKASEDMSLKEQRHMKRPYAQGAFRSLFLSSEGEKPCSNRPPVSKEGPLSSSTSRASLSLPARPKPHADVNHSLSAVPAERQPGNWKQLERPDHNSHVVHAQSEIWSQTPDWYIEDVAALPRDHPDYLCATCRHIHLAYLFNRSEPRRTAPPKEYISLGRFSEMAEQTTCGLCRIVTATIRLRVDLGTGQEAAQLGPEAQRLLTAKWYLSPFVYSHEQYGPGFQLFLRHGVFDKDQQADTTHTLPSHPFALRLVTNTERGGRRIPAGHLDFAWIKATIDLCELSTDMPPREFDYPIRVVDTLDMCVVDLGIEDQYVALSYPWGMVNQLRFVQQNESLLRRPGALSQFFGQLARTIQDAIILVSKVGMRYLWLDSLCIVQDNEADLKEQMAQMGEIYRHSHFTIFAISGQDANYGLPGVRQGSRQLTQALEEVSGLTIVNSLPWMEEEDLLRYGAWGSRAWTFQERFRTQRGLFIGDNGMIINCMHVYSPEDEHCSHSLTRNEQMLATGDMVFFAGQDKRCEPYLKKSRTNFDSFAQYVYEYSQRKLTYQSDALPAFLGVLSTLQDWFQSDFLYGIPEVEFDAGLLWSPLGSSFRRSDFPSWSWLGWIGNAAYPWTHERDTFISTETSPLRWLDAAVTERNQRTRKVMINGRVCYPQSGPMALCESSVTDAAWFTSDDLCLPASPERERLLRYWCKQTNDHLGARRACRAARNQSEWRSNTKFLVTWPNGQVPNWKYTLPDARIFHKLNSSKVFTDHRLTFRTLSAHFYVVGQPFRRKRLYNMQNPIWQLAVCDEAGILAGHIDIPDPNSGRKIAGGSREFIVLSRSTIDGKFEPAPDSLENRRRKPISPEPATYGRAQLKAIEEIMSIKWRADHINERGWFDTTVYDENRPWCMFNVLMLTYNAGWTYRDTIGRIHVDAFLAHRPVSKVIELD
jgi:hypothetical protein